MKTLCNAVPLITTLLLIMTTSAYSQADVEGLIRSTGQFPKLELYDNGPGEFRVEFNAREAGDNIFLESFRGDIRIGASDNGGTPSNYLTLNPEGFLGFNDQIPEAPIHINDPTFDYNLLLSGTGINWNKDNGETWGSIGHFLGSFVVNNTTTPTNPALATFLLSTDDAGGNNDPHILISGDGNVAIGHDVAQPLSDLVLSHSNCSTGCSDEAVRFNNTNGNNWWGFYTSSVTGNLLLYSKLQGDNIIGTFNDNSGAYSSSSNEALKSNIRTLPDVLKKVSSLRPAEYNYKSQKNMAEKHIGFIAQELNTVFPEFVTHIEDQDMYTVNYAGMSTVAIKAIQEQQVIIESLQQTINDLETRLQAVESK